MENAFNTSIWEGEGFSAILSMKSLPDIIRIISRDTSPPLFNITEHLAFQAFGTSEVVIRGLTFFYFLLAVFFTALLANHWWGKKTALFAALLTFFNPFFFMNAFEGRMYSILALGVVASMYFFVRRKWIPYVLATLWALYSHQFAIFSLFVQGIWFLKTLIWGKKETAKKMFKAFIAVGIFYVPWMIPLYNQMRMVGGVFWLGTPTVEDLYNLIFDYIAKGIRHELSEPVLYIVLIAFLIRNWLKSLEESAFLLIWFFVPILATWLISQQFQSIFFNSYLLYTIPAAMLLLASKRRGTASNIILSVIIATFALIDYNYFTHPAKRPFKQLSVYVHETQKPGDYLINWNAESHHLWEMKYYGIEGPLYIPQGGDLPFFVGAALFEDKDIIRSLPEDATRIGVVTSGSLDNVILPENYSREEAKELRDLNFAWYIKEDTDKK